MSYFNTRLLCFVGPVHLLQVEEAVSLGKKTVTPHLSRLRCQPIKLVWLVLL